MSLPQLTDQQKKIVKSSVIALLLVLGFLVLGVLFTKEKTKGTLTNLFSSKKSLTVQQVKGETSVTTPDLQQQTTAAESTKGKTDTNPKKGINKIVSFVRDFFSGKTTDDYIKAAISESKDANILKEIKDQAPSSQTPKGTPGSGVNSHGLATSDSKVLEQLQSFHETSTSTQTQISTISHQLSLAQEQLASYSTGVTGNSNNTVFQTTQLALQTQITQYQNQLAQLQTENTLAA